MEKELPEMIKLEEQDIDVTKKIIEVMGDVAVFVAQAVKEGWKSAHMFQLMGMMNQVVDIVKDREEILPELKDIDKDEAAEITGMLYDYVREIVVLATQEKEEK